MQISFKPCLMATVSIVSLSFVPSNAYGQSSGEQTGRITDEIIVTARKKEETLQQAPLAVSAVSGAQLERAGIDSFDEILNVIPNAGQSGGIGGSIQGLISIRGISTLVRFVGLETGVGFYVDGVYMGRPENFNQDLIDIERVEVLRGPQGALFGKNTIAGAINIITKDPSDTLTGVVEAQYGNFNHTRLRGNISGPISDTLSASLSAGYTSRDGFVKHLSDGKDLDDANLTTLRGKVKFAPSDSSEFILSADYLKDDSNPSFFEVSQFALAPFGTAEDQVSLTTPFTTNNEFDNTLERDIWGTSLTGNIALGEGELDVVLGYRSSEFQASLDDDKTSLEIFPDRFSQDTEALSAEVRYSGDLGDKLDYVVGAYYYNQDANGIGDFAGGRDLFAIAFATVVPDPVPILLTSSVDSESIALFFNTNYALAENLNLEVGGRWVSETKDATHVQQDFTGLFGNTDFAIKRTDKDFAPTVSLSYDVNSDNTFYVRYAEGFKSAGFNTDFVTAGVSNLEVDPEFATAYEVGLKSTFADGRARLNLAAFTTDYEDLQLSQIVGGGVSLTNAAEATISGFEAELVASLNDYFDLNASLGYLDATYDEFENCPAGGGIAVTPVSNCAGNTLNLAPEITTAVGGQFTYPVSFGALTARVDVNHRSEVFFEPQNERRLSGDDRTLVNLRAGIQTDQWSLMAWAKNLTDETYVNFADDRSAITVNTTQSFGAPRTYGATLRYNF